MWTTLAALNLSMLVQAAFSAAEFTAFLKARVENVAPDTASTPEPLASNISGIIMSKAMSPTWAVSVCAVTSSSVILSAVNLARTWTGPLYPIDSAVYSPGVKVMGALLEVASPFAALSALLTASTIPLRVIVAPDTASITASDFPINALPYCPKSGTPNGTSSGASISTAVIFSASTVTFTLTGEPSL